MQKKQIFIWLLFITLSQISCQSERKLNENKADVVIYGGTSAAITAAVQVAQMGKSVIIVSPDKHLGGLSSSGLGFTDTGNKEVIGGLAREFYQLIYQHYQQPSAWKWQNRSEYGNKGQGNPAIDGEKRTMWIFEPHAAEDALEQMITVNNINVFRGEFLDRQNGVVLQDQKIVSITTLSGKKFRAKVFIDATYEGDLMASAGVSYHVGREANSTYNEEWNGIQTGVLHHGHHFKTKIDPYIVQGDPTSGLLPRISADAPGNKGEEDSRIQAYCFRMCLTNIPENRLPFFRPEAYDSSQYELLVRVYNSGWDETFDKFDPIPNHKTDVNNHGPFSFDNIGMNYDYPEASYKEREKIIQEHKNYQAGLLYFIANDPRIPKDTQEKMREWGYSKDEFADNGNWPYNIYVREARRMIGKFVMTENELLGRTETPMSIGMGSYTIDSHNVQRYVKPDGFVQNEGDIGVKLEKPYTISLNSILPKEDECDNLIVPVCVSSSHIAFGSIRMEPVFMILGQSAGTLAALAVNNGTTIHQVTYDELKNQLMKDGQILKYQE